MTNNPSLQTTWFWPEVKGLGGSNAREDEGLCKRTGLCLLKQQENLCNISNVNSNILTETSVLKELCFPSAPKPPCHKPMGAALPPALRSTCPPDTEPPMGSSGGWCCKDSRPKGSSSQKSTVSIQIRLWQHVKLISWFISHKRSMRNRKIRVVEQCHFGRGSVSSHGTGQTSSPARGCFPVKVQETHYIFPPARRPSKRNSRH